MIALYLLSLLFAFSPSEKKAISYANPAWSPDGTRLAFESNLEGQRSIYTIRTDGTELRRLTDTTYEDGQPDWSPDGRQIAFYSRRNGRQQLYCMQADGSDQLRISQTEHDEFDPDWSPDGQWLAFLSRPPGSDCHALTIMRPDGSDRRTLSDSRQNCFRPSWSPDGSQIACVVTKPMREYSISTYADLKAHMEIWCFLPEGEPPVQLTQNEVADRVPFWAADGKLVYFIREEGLNEYLYSIKPSGKQLKKRRLANWVGEPALSPDGKRLAFRSHIDGCFGLFLSKLDGSGVVRLICQER